MKKLLCGLVLLCMLSANKTYACDACGCSVNSGGVGLLAHFNKRFAGMTYMFVPFESSSAHEEKYSDNLHQVQASFSFFVYKGIKLTAIQKYKYNARFTNGNENSVHGLGDLMVQVNVPLVQSKSSLNNPWRVDMTLGAELPIGKHRTDLHALNLPENFAIGEGNYSIYMMPSFSIKRAKNSFYLNAYAQYNTKSFDGFRFGHQLSTQGYYAYEYDVKKTTFIPLLGGNYEYVAANKYANNKAVQNSGGQGLFLFTGLHLNWKNLFVGGTYSYPVYQNYANKDVYAIARWTSQLTYIF